MVIDRTTWQVVGVEGARLIWAERPLTYWEALMFPVRRDGAFIEQWMMLAAFEKGGCWNEEGL